MNVMIFGATGMVGQGALRECLNAQDVTQVLTVGRAATGQRHPKLKEIVHPSMSDWQAIEDRLTGFDACFFCLGVSVSGMTEADYTRLTYDLTLSVAQTLSRLNPQMTFVYVSGAGTDSSEQGRSMWARVKRRTENALLRLPFKAVFLFRPGVIQPLHGARSRTTWYRLFYAASRPVMPLLRALFPAYVLTTESIGQAMLTIARSGAPKPVLESQDIYRLSKSAAAPHSGSNARER